MRGGCKVLGVVCRELARHMIVGPIFCIVEQI